MQSSHPRLTGRAPLHRQSRCVVCVLERLVEGAQLRLECVDLFGALAFGQRDTVDGLTRNTHSASGGLVILNFARLHRHLSARLDGNFVEKRDAPLQLRLLMHGRDQEHALVSNHDVVRRIGNRDAGAQARELVLDAIAFGHEFLELVRRLFALRPTRARGDLRIQLGNRALQILDATEALSDRAGSGGCHGELRYFSAHTSVA